MPGRWYRTEPCFVKEKNILGRKRVDAGGAIQLAGKTLTVEISDLLKGGFPNFGFNQM